MTILVSPEFKEKIYATERKTTANVSFELLDNTAYDDATIIVSGEATISKSSQLINKVRSMTHRYASFERDYFKLDGSSHIPPKATESTDELGWWSDVLSGGDGTFAVPPILEILFGSEHSSVGLTLHFDTKADEYPTDFTIEIFDLSDSLILTETVTGNTSAIYSFETLVEGYKRLRFTFTKMSKASRRLKVVEIDFGRVQRYSGEKIISLKVIEEIDLLGSFVPSDEIQITLDNSEREFSILNPDGVYKFLKQNQEMRAEIGLEIEEGIYEYIPMGVFYLTQWTVEEGAMTSTFVGRDIFTRVDALDYTRLKRSTNLYDLAVDVLSEANINNYKIDESLKNVSTVGFGEPIKIREALQMIGIAGCSVVRQNREGQVVIEKYDEITLETGYATFAGPDMYAGMTTPQVTSDFDFQLIDFENAYEVPKVSLNQNVKYLKVHYYDLNGIRSTGEYTNMLVEDGIGYEVDNPLISSWADSLAVIGWMFREYNLIADYQASWRQNPALECGDLLLIQDSFEGLRKSRIIKNEFNFQGYLDGVTEAKGGV